MKDTKSLSHTSYRCKYHIVIVPKFRRMVIYNKLRHDIRLIIKTLIERKPGVELIEGELCPDHIHLLLEIPPKYSVAEFMGYLKSKSTLMIFDRHASMKYKYGNRKFWARGYFVDTVGKNEKTVREYIQNQLKEDLEYANKNADYNIIIMHWGNAYSTKPSKEQKNMAKFLVENGADIILGNHASAVQNMEIMKNKDGDNALVAYSLGNYISAETMDVSKIELVLNIEIRTDAENKKTVLSKVEYTPIYVLDNGEKAGNRYELIDMKGTAKAYANGNTKIVKKDTYNKLLDGLKLLERIIK